MATQRRGGPERLRELLEAMVAEVEADELMIHDLIAEPLERLDSYRLIAAAFDLRGDARPRAATAADSRSGAAAHAR